MSENKDIIVLIPVYKSVDLMTNSELDSILNTLKVLRKYDIVFLGASKLQSEYNHKFPAASFRCFSDRYFKSVSGYNQLLLSNNFYEQFAGYDKMMIVQTDAWVFSDDLSEFLQYDYIGSPWVYPPVYLEKYDETTLGLVGNGGFSIRGIAFCISVLASSNKILTLKELINNSKILYSIVYQKKSVFLKFGMLVNMLSLYVLHNRLSSAHKFYRYINEDVLFGVLSVKAGIFNLPSPLIAANFAVETCIPPGTDINRVIGCHSFERRSNQFWKERIANSINPEIL